MLWAVGGSEVNTSTTTENETCKCQGLFMSSLVVVLIEECDCMPDCIIFTSFANYTPYLGWPYYKLAIYLWHIIFIVMAYYIYSYSDLVAVYVVHGGVAFANG